MRRFSDIWKWFTPGWLQAGEGELVQRAQGMMLDAFAERCYQTARINLPSICPESALPYLAHDRAIPRGLFEPADSFRLRLIAWRYPRGHRIRGGALALLEQLAAGFRGSAWTTIDARGTRYDFGTDTATRGYAWDWDGAEGASIGSQWGRYWVVIKSTGAPWPSFTDGAWGDTVLGDPGVVVGGSGVHPGEVEAVRTLVRNTSLGWTPAGRRAIYLTWYFPADLFPAPTGDWDDWANRDSAYRYVPLHSSVT